jgi:hypothetical protein
MMSEVAPPHVAEHVGALVFDLFRHLAGRRVAAEDDAGHQEVADAAGIGNGIGVLELADMNALAPCHHFSPFGMFLVQTNWQDTDPNWP